MPGPLEILAFAVPLIVAITFHEAAHGWVAWKLGDGTAQRLGRVTFNPIKHVDLVGTILLPAALIMLTWQSGGRFLFGWAKPVPIDPRAFGNPRRDMILVAAAGPGINFVLALVSGLLLGLYGPPSPGEAGDAIHHALSISVFFNALLAVFNLIPLPPLDGGRLAVGLLPGPLAYRLIRIERWGLLILIGVLFILPLATRPLGYEINPFTWVILPIIEGVAGLVTAIGGAELVFPQWL